MVIKYVIVGILALQKLAIFEQNAQMMVMAVFYSTRTEDEFSKEMLENSKIWRFLGTHTYRIIFRW